MSALSHHVAHDIARDLGCLVPSQHLARSRNDVESAPAIRFSGLSRALASVRAWNDYRVTLAVLRRMPSWQLADLGIERGQLREVAAAAVAKRA